MWEKIKSGKVRDIYENEDGDKVKIVASDRVSAFDKILPVTIPNKGKILTKISKKMFEVTESVYPNACLSYYDTASNEIVMMQLDMIPVEFVVRGYMFGSLWDAYQDGCRFYCGNRIPDGLKEGDALPEPILTPTTKGEVGEHDEPISFEEMREVLKSYCFGEENAEILRSAALDLYMACAQYCASRGYILADTKFEFGMNFDGEILLADEVCTPDSSRFWKLDEYNAPERKIVSADKQVIRDYIKRQKKFGIDVAKLPDGIIAKTQDQYSEICKALTGEAK